MPVKFRNILGLSLLTLLGSLHLLILIVTVFNFFPIKVDPAVWQRYFQFHFSAIKPEREILFYRLWVLSGIASQAAILWWFRNQLGDVGLLRRLRAFIINEAVFLFLLLFCVFKGLVGGDPLWVKVLFYALLVLSWGVRIFWPEACRLMKRIHPVKIGPMTGIALNGVIVLAIILFLYPVDIESVLARVFIQERFYHFDAVMMSPGWALLMGSVLNIDVITLYGITSTHMVVAIAQWMGGFTYEHVLWVYVYATILYFIIGYFVLRFWLGSALLAAAGIFLSIKFQMFHWGTGPLIWEFLSATVVRYLFDIVFLFFILHHIRFRTWGLIAATLCSGVSWAYMIDTGTYQWLTLCTYLLVLLWERVYLEKKSFLRQWGLLVAAVSPILIAILILRALGGPAVFSAEFWRNGFEQANEFINGMGALPFYDNLTQGHFFAFFMGILIPCVYVFSMLYMAAAFMLGNTRRENMFVVVLCVYGLGLYHYFICRSALSSYHSVDIPFVFLMFFWVREALALLNEGRRRTIGTALLVLCMGALLTNSLFTYYPNALNIARYDWAKEKEFYRREFHFEDDAQLISRLTSPAEKVVLISNMETKILMEAKRKPFFYHFPLLYPNFMNADVFDQTHLHTTDRLGRILRDLKTAQPAYIFVEAQIFNGHPAQHKYGDGDALSLLMGYVRKEYEQVGQGKYLLALRRKGAS